MDLAYLPPEMIEEVASYLNLADILACSRVNLQWQKAFNLERIWKRFTITSDPNYYGTKISKMNYSSSSNMSQPEPCPSKELVSRELFVKNNFLNGRLRTEEIDLGLSYCDCIKETVDKAGNHWLFVSVSDGPEFESQHRIQVWNLNGRPVLHTSLETPHGGISVRPIDSQMKVFGDRFYYVQEDFVLIYEFTHPQYELRFLRKIELSKSRFPDQVFMSSMMICLPDIIIGFAYTHFHINQHLPPSYEVYGPDGASICNNFASVDLVANTVCTSHPVMLVKKNDLDDIIVVYEFYSLDWIQYNFGLKVFDSKTLDYKGKSFCTAGKLNTFDVHRHVVIMAYSVRDPPLSFDDEMHVATYNTESGTSLQCNSLEYDTTCGVSITRAEPSVSWEVVAIGRKVLSVLSCTVDGLELLLSFPLPKKGVCVSVLRNNLIIVELNGKDIIYELYNYKTANKLYRLELPKHQLFFSFKKKCSFPTNLIAYSTPNSLYAQPVTRTSIFIISFW